MYEKETQEAILARMLKNVPRDVDKREGSIIFDAAAPASIEFMLLYAELDYFLKNTFGDTAERVYLIQRARERGLKPKGATSAVVKGKFTPPTLNIPLGTRYSCGAASFDSQAYGGNIADYRQKVNAIHGIGGVKVYPVWKGGGTVRIVFMTSDFKPPTAELVQKAQTAIDPETNHGEGIGIAPIGHTVTVEGAKNAAVKIGLHLSFAAGTSYANYKTQVEETIDAYFAELNKAWQDTQHAEIDNVSNAGITIRISQIESRLLALTGIEDIQHTTLNDREENLMLGVDALAVRGEVQNG